MPNIWDDSEYSIHTALMQLNALQSTLPDSMEYTTARNRITMAMMHLEDARDRLAAARARVPQEQ